MQIDGILAKLLDEDFKFVLQVYHSPKSLLLLHFSTNFSETFRINVNMDFAQTNHGFFGFWAQGVGFFVNDTWAKWGFEIWPLW